MLCLGNNESQNLSEYKKIHIKRISWGNVRHVKVFSKLIDRVLLNNILWRTAIDKFIDEFNIKILILNNDI